MDSVQILDEIIEKLNRFNKEFNDKMDELDLSMRHAVSVLDEIKNGGNEDESKNSLCSVR